MYVKICGKDETERININEEQILSPVGVVKLVPLNKMRIPAK